MSVKGGELIVYAAMLHEIAKRDRQIDQLERQLEYKGEIIATLVAGLPAREVDAAMVERAVIAYWDATRIATPGTSFRTDMHAALCAALQE